MNAKTGTEKNRLVDLWHLIEALRSDDQESSAFGYILWCIFDIEQLRSYTASLPGHFQVLH